eukprot:CFRG4900T1
MTASACNDEEFLANTAGVTDLACGMNGGTIIFATDNFFAAADNMLKRETPVFIDDKFTQFGKWMDGWETRRKRTPGHDWCILKLGVGGTISHAEINTAFFSGNYAPRASLQGAWIEDDSDLPGSEAFNNTMGTIASKEDYERADAYKSDQWEHLLEQTPMGAGYPETCRNFFKFGNAKPYTHIRINIFPDGGVARLCIYGQPKISWEKLIKDKTELDLASVINGGTGIAHSNAHYGNASNLIATGRARKMDEGWETKRKDDRPAILQMGADGLLDLPGDDWAIIKLGHKGLIDRVLIDTNHFKGNFPESCIIQGCCYEGSEPGQVDSEGNLSGCSWSTIVSRCKLSAHEEVIKSSESRTPITHVKLSIFPDGGVSRLRVYGQALE